MKNFQDVLDECGLVDLGFVGSKFTWFKNFADGIQCGRGWIRRWELYIGSKNA